jgi:hypothetical protein
MSFSEVNNAPSLLSRARAINVPAFKLPSQMGDSEAEKQCHDHVLDGDTLTVSFSQFSNQPLNFRKCQSCGWLI